MLSILCSVLSLCSHVPVSATRDAIKLTLTFNLKAQTHHVKRPFYAARSEALCPS